MNLSFTDSGGNFTSTETERKLGKTPRMRLVCLPARLPFCGSLGAGFGDWESAAEFAAPLWLSSVLLGSSGSGLLSVCASAGAENRPANTKRATQHLEGINDNTGI